jgi:Domain of Unknown Function (DUF1080)
MTLSPNRWSATLTLATISTALLVAKLSDAPAATAGQAAAPNQLTDADKKAGWKLLFDGKSLNGWHNFKKEGATAGWSVKDGVMVCAEKNARDLVTNDKFDWFELSLEYNIPPKGNSGILFHVTNDGNTTYATGPEIQLLDNKLGGDAQLSGWLYQLYRPDLDPKTNKPLDATKPAGEWNHVRVVIAPPPAKSQVDMNGEKYYDFVLHSDDFNARVAKSKFGNAKQYPNFAKSDTGFIALQGDHGAVSFRNVKVKAIGGKTD